MKKRLISMLLILCMVFSLLPVSVLAADEAEPTTVTMQYDDYILCRTMKARSRSLPGMMYWK